METEFCCGLIRFTTMLVRQVCMERVFCGVLDQSVSAFEDFVNQLCGDLVNSFPVGLEKVYSDSFAECFVALTSISGAIATSLS